MCTVYHHSWFMIMLKKLVLESPKKVWASHSLSLTEIWMSLKWECRVFPSYILVFALWHMMVDPCFVISHCDTERYHFPHDIGWKGEHRCPVSHVCVMFWNPLRTKSLEVKSVRSDFVGKAMENLQLVCHLVILLLLRIITWMCAVFPSVINVCRQHDCSFSASC
jgi:hypothetical protein